MTPLPDHPVCALVVRLQGVDLGGHPLFQRLQARPFSRSALWLLLSNFYAASKTGGGVTEWLARLAAAVEDDRLRCLIVHQLDRELGQGDSARAQVLLQERLLSEMTPWQPGGLSESSFGAGRSLGAGLRAYLTSPEPYCGVGGFIASTLFTGKLLACLGRELSRQGELPERALVWLRLREEPAAGGAATAMALAQLVAPAGAPFDATLLGLEGVWRLFAHFLDAMNRVC